LRGVLASPGVARDGRLAKPPRNGPNHARLVGQRAGTQRFTLPMPSEECLIS